jgi:hypothetical protein
MGNTMYQRMLKVGGNGLSVVVLLSMVACASPQPEEAATPASPPGTSPISNVSTSSNSPAPAVAVTAIKVQVPSKYQQQLEMQLLCPAKSLLSVTSMRKASMEAGIIGPMGKEQSDGSIVYPVNADLSVFGHKVLALELVGEDNEEGATVMAHVDATPAQMAKLFRRKHIVLKQRKGNPGHWAKRHHGLYTGYDKSGALLKMGCFAPII